MRVTTVIWADRRKGGARPRKQRRSDGGANHIGSPAELAETFLQYKRIGVSQFIISDWPMLDEMVIFGREVLPSLQ
jgi:alkanesulfonate monooxygenase SsuD/methylene tetrahydromethanopterin reductase-like flavin-dependent oxidoreductase (luciferase family)